MGAGTSGAHPGFFFALSLTVEDTLVQPTFVYDYPVEISPHAKCKTGKPWRTERFEVLVAGRELCNAFSALTPPKTSGQAGTVPRSVQKSAAGYEEAYVMDEDFVTALSSGGMPPTGGMGIGVDCLGMLLRIVSEAAIWVCFSR